MCTNPHLPITSVYTHRVKVLIYITCTNISPVCIICMDKCHCLNACMCVCRYNNQLYYTTSSMNEPLSPSTYTWPQLWPTYLRLLECTQSSIPTGQPDKFSHSTLQLSHTPLGLVIHVHTYINAQYIHVHITSYPLCSLMHYISPFILWLCYDYSLVYIAQLLLYA